MTQVTNENHVGEVLRLLRIARDLSISDLSEKAQISKSYITEIEKGKKKPSEKIIKNYSQGLNISEDSLNYMLNNYSKTHLPYRDLLLEILKRIVDLDEE